MKNLVCALFLLSAIGCRTTNPSVSFDPANVPPVPDYARISLWAAHPDKSDPADRTPCPYIKDEQATAQVDVFFLYPTTYTGDKRSQRDWNCAVENQSINTKTDETSILFQASAFNGAGRIFAPRYRQAHLYTFFAEDKKSAKQALDLAYEDAKAAFQYYLKHWNQGRPFILAGHSQGARHAMYLIRDFVENMPLEQQLVAAYIVGWPVNKQFYQHIHPCQSPDQTGCYCTWRTFERDFGLRKFTVPDSNLVCTNPLNWTTVEGRYVDKSANLGGVVRPFCAVYPNMTDAEVHNGYLLCTKPKFPGSVLIRSSNFHAGDINLYYMNVRDNAKWRVKMYMQR